MNEQELLLAVIGYIMATKKQPKSELEVQAIAQEVAGMKQSDPKQYQQLVRMGQQALQQQPGAKVAALGAKLDYINKLKGNCPEGEELVYMKEGGRVCPKCMKKAEKAKGGTNLLKKNAISDFREKRIAPSDTVHVGGQPRSLTDSQNRPLVKGMKTYSASEYQKDMKDAKKGKKDAANRVEKSDMKTAYGCGGSAKKLVKKKKK